uniref:Leucine-rich repeat protein SHOC-2 n=1 Tax=Sus scrofa TaxID=9823 RepID=A0A8D1A6R9_PIG
MIFLEKRMVAPCLDSSYERWPQGVLEDGSEGGPRVKEPTLRASFRLSPVHMHLTAHPRNGACSFPSRWIGAWVPPTWGPLDCYVWVCVCVLKTSCSLFGSQSEFCGLTHLVKLDLSKNKLRQLPADFGRLVNLQHLDLLNNRLVTLPVSFAQLKSLKWLDLKDNPLDPVLAKVAGDCLDEKQCKQCANKVLQHMKAVQADQERERQRRLEIDREAEKKWEAKQRAKEAQERELRKREKAEEKERRRKEYDALKAAKREQEKKPKKETNQAPKSKSGSRPRKPPPRKHTRSWAVLKQPLCTSVNTIYDNAVRGLRSHDIVQWVLQTDSQQ